MTYIMADLLTTSHDKEHPLISTEILAIGMGVYSDGDLETEVFTKWDDVPPASAFRSSVMGHCGCGIGEACAPMLGLKLVGWNIRSYVWPRICFELFSKNERLYNLAAPLSKKYSDVDMLDLRNILSQGNYIADTDLVTFGQFLTFLYHEGDRSQFELSDAELDAFVIQPAGRDRVVEVMSNRLMAIADLYERYTAFAGKE